MKHVMTEIILRSLQSFLLPLSAILLQNNTAFAFVPQTRITALHNHHSSRVQPILAPPLSSFPPDNTNDPPNDDDAWQTALRQRQQSIQNKKSATRNRWLNAEFTQSLLSTPDWVRRVSVRWPLAVCGTSSGDIYVLHCESNTVLAKGGSNVDQRRYQDVPLSTELTTTLKRMFGDYDGGGTLAVGISWINLVAHAGRNGGVELWSIDTDVDYDGDLGERDEPDELIPRGTLLEDVLVTCLDWAEDDLWIGTGDGRVLVYTIDEDEMELPSEPVREWTDLGGTVLSVKYDGELDVAAVTMSSGSVLLLTAEEPGFQGRFDPPFDSGRMSSNAFPLCALIVEEEVEEQEKPPNTPASNDRRFSIACGGNDGSVFLRSLRLLPNTIDPTLDLQQPFTKDSPTRSLVPSHNGPCKCLASPLPGILVSGGQDGIVRVWELDAEPEFDEPSAGKYFLIGFKVWLGSFWTDGERLVMDGADNSISILDFGG